MGGWEGLVTLQISGECLKAKSRVSVASTCIPQRKRARGQRRNSPHFPHPGELFPSLSTSACPEAADRYSPGTCPSACQLGAPC